MKDFDSNDQDAIITIIDALIVKRQVEGAVTPFDQKHTCGQEDSLMTRPMQNTQALIEKIHSLPPDRIAEVEDFVDFLRERTKSRKTTTTNKEPLNAVRAAYQAK